MSYSVQCIMDERINNINSRLNAAYNQIVAIRNSRNRGDLFSMLGAVERILKSISKESVICRQRKRTTLRYEDLVQQCTEALEMLEKYVVFASLMNT